MSKTHTTSDPVLLYTNAHSSPLHPAQQKLLKATLDRRGPGMLSSADQLQLLQTLISCMRAKKTLDIGVYTGFSALSIALVLPDDGKVVACDVDDYDKFAKPFWEEAGVGHKIDLRIAPAAETLEKLIADGESGTYDFAFIDADKPNYKVYYELSLKLLRTGGVIALDNVLWGGRVVDSGATEKYTRALQDVNDFVASDPRVSAVMLRIGDGTTIARKL